ncbi:Bug family tripartite tricarboxylate transporter substrate binding protein [Reyranella sp.]|uniref:Bug family tripartite tricarboxylate transporter substrate binding protein n=1 Tax=Reyranella sp. TaxID=1929291 RepID=UPI003D122E9A
MNPTRRRILAASTGVLATPALFTRASAQGGAAFPSKPIRIIVPYPAGGQTDGIARSFGDFLARKFGQTVIVENKGGAGGAIGAVEVKRAAPDGYTILCTISSSLIQNRVTVKDLPYDPEKDFTYLAMTTSTGGPVVAAEKTGARNLAEFVAYAKKVDKVNWGAYGAGSTPHVLIESMAKQYGFKVEIVQYRGEAAMWADVTSQQLDGASGSPAGASPVIASGKGRIIAVVGDRLSAWPDTPTMQEQGAKGGFYDTRAFAAFAVPSATPPDIAKKLADALFEAGTDPKVQQLRTNYLIKGPLNFADTNARFKRDTEVMLAVLKEIGLKPE